MSVRSFRKTNTDTIYGFYDYYYYYYYLAFYMHSHKCSEWQKKINDERTCMKQISK